MSVVAHPTATGHRIHCTGAATVNATVRAMAELTATVNDGAAIRDVLELVAAKVAQMTGHVMALVMQPNETTRALEVLTAHGISANYIDTITQHPVMTTAGGRGEAPTSRAYRSRRPVVATGLEANLPVVWGRTASREGIGSMVSLPLIVAQEVRYVVNVYCSDPSCFDDASVLLIENFASLVSLLLDNHAAGSIRTSEAEAHRRQINALQSKCHAMRVAQVNLDELHGLVVQDAGLDRLLHRLHEMTGARLHVYDMFGRTLAGESSGDDHDHLLKRAVVLDEEVVATLTIRCADADTLTRPEVATVLHTAPTLVAMMLMRHWVALDAEARQRGDLLEELLSAPGVGDLPLAAHARSRWGIDLTTPNRLVVVRITAPSDSAPSTRNPTPVRRSLLAAAEEFVKRSPVAYLAAEFDRQLVVLVSDCSTQAASEFAEALRRDVGAYAADAIVSVAVADSSDTVEGHRDAYRHAVALLNLMGESAEPARTATVEQFGLFRLMLDVKRPQDLIQFADRTLRPLRDYDALRRAELVETLRVYLDTECSTSETARRLFLHQNSVSYRLKRISGILGLNSLTEPKVLLPLELALTIDRLIAPSPDSAP
ncbi:helix-turn-helix domain-containing protein [Prescottella agglutinans]|nr:helix-turn-helix domain-containing protein [Prescottella agglutinans]